MAFYTFPPFLLPNAPDPDATEEEMQEWRERIAAFLRQSSLALEEIGEAYIGFSAQMADLIVSTAKIQDAAITTAKIGTAAITEALIEDAAITTAKIADAAIITAKIANAQITESLIVDGAITTDKIAAQAVTAAKIQAGSITSNEVAADTISVDNLVVGNFDNVVENPGFEIATSATATAIPGWSNSPNTTAFARTTNTPRTGTYAMRFQGGSSGSLLVSANQFPVASGQQWYAETYIRPVATNSTGAAAVQIAWRQADGTFISADIGNSIDSAGGSYALSSLTATAPSGAALGEVWLGIVTAPSAAGWFNVDDFYARRKIGGAYIETAAIDNAHIQDAAITTAKIDDAQISTAKIIDLNVTGAKIADATITTAKIGSAQITEDLIVDGSITTAKIAAGAVTAAEIAAGTITGSLIAADTITTGNLIVGNFDNAVENPGFETNTAAGTTTIPGWTTATAFAITAASPRSGGFAAQYTGTTITALRIANLIPVGGGQEWYGEAYILPAATNTTAGSRIALQWRDTAGVAITTHNGTTVDSAGSNYALSSISATSPTSAASLDVILSIFSGGSSGSFVQFDDVYVRRKIGTAFIEDAAIGTALIEDAAITTAKILDANITTAKIADANITTAKIGAAQITTALIANLNITNALIASGAITADKIAANTITANEIAAGTITTTEIAAGTIVAGNIAASTILGSNIAANTLTTSNLIVGSFNNEIQNPSFELSTANGATTSPGWTAGATGFTYTTDTPRTGQYTARYQGTAITTLEADFRPGVTELDEWHIEAYVLPGANNTTGAANIQIQWLGPNESAISTVTGNAVNSAGGDYALSQLDATAPAGVAFAILRMGIASPPSAGGLIQFDDFIARRKTGTAYIEDAAITTAKIANLAVTEELVASGAITAAKIAANTITAAQIAAGTITTTQIASATILADNIAANTILGENIAADTIHASALIVSSFDNAVENSSFELATSAAATGETFPGWTSNVVGFALTTDTPRSGKYAARFTGTAAVILTNSHRVTVQEGEEYYTEAYCLPGASNTTAAGFINVTWRDSTGGLVLQQSGNTVNSAGSDYAISTIAGSVPAGAVYCDVRLRCSPPPSAGGLMQFDDVYFRRKLGGAYIEDAAIGTALIQDASVTTAKIVDANITTAKIANANITSAKIAGANITTALIANLAVTTAKIDDLAVTGAKIANATIGTANIANAAIGTAALADAAVTNAKIVDAAITNAKIGNLAVDTAQIADLAIEEAKLANLAVTDAKIANATITSAKIASLDAADITTGVLNVDPAAGGATAIYIQDAGKLRMETALTTPAKIVFEDGSQVEKMELTGNTNALALQPSADNSHALDIGGPTRRWSDIDIRAQDVSAVAHSGDLILTGSNSIQLSGALRTDQAAALDASNTKSGYRIPVRNIAGTLLGYLQLYDA